MKLAVIGPDLHDHSKGSFHVHTAACRDGLNKRKYPMDARTVADCDTKAEVVEFVYGDVASDHATPGTPEYAATLASYASDIYFHACTTGLA